MDAWLHQRGVTLVGADPEESPMSYRRLPEVLGYHFAATMAGEGEFDPFKD